MKLKIFLLTFLAVWLVPTAHADTERFFRDIKLPTQQMIEKQDFGTAATASATTLSTGITIPSAAAKTVTTFSAQPDVARNIVVTPTGTTDDVNACVVTVSGLNFFYKPISETFTLTASQSSASTGSKAFQSVSSVAFPANCAASPFAATFNVGTGVKLGLKRCMNAAGDWLHSSTAGVKDTTAATIAADPTHVESNTASFNTAPNGSNDLIAYFMQSFGSGCHP